MWNNITTYMNDKVMEDMNFILGKCRCREFLEEYLARDEEFDYLLYEQFDIDFFSQDIKFFDEVEEGEE